MQLLFEGLSNEQIGQRLGIAEKTVEGHLAEARQRLGVPDGARGWAYAARRLHLRRCSGCCTRNGPRKPKEPCP